MLRWALVGVGSVAALAAGGPFIYIHFIEGPPPAKLTLPTTTNTHGDHQSTRAHSGGSTRAGGAALTAGPDSLNGTWRVSSGSVAGYRVQEVLVGQHSTAVGRTSEIWGSVTVADGTVTKGSFTVNMASVKSDQAMRNAQFDGRIMDVATYPTATLVITSPIALSPLAANDHVKEYSAGGKLTMHGKTVPVTFTVSAERTATSVYVLADVHIVFASWGISNPSVGGFVTTSSSGTLEVLLHLTKGQGNKPALSVASSSPGGAPGPVTVPRTTVPPLKVPQS